MNVVTVPFSSYGRTILNPIYSSIIDDVAETIEVDSETIKVLLQGLEVAKTDNRNNISLKEENNLPTTNSTNRFTVKVNTDYHEDYIDTTAVHRDEHYPIFLDPVTCFKISPVYLQMAVTLEFEYHSPSLIEVGTMRDKIRLAISRTRNIDHHDVEYTMLIPQEVEELIGDIYDLRNRLIPQELEEYFREYASPRIYPITDMYNLENAMLGISEKQVNVIGRYEFSPLPDKPERDKETNSTKLNFTYSFEISIPRFLRVQYPTMVCNRLIPSKYLEIREESRSKTKEDKLIKRTHIGKSYEAMSSLHASKQLEHTRDIDFPINIPSFDYLDETRCRRGYVFYMTLLLEVDETDNKTLFNLNDLGDYTLSPTFKRLLLEDERHFITRPYESYVYIGLHQDGRHFDNSILTVDEDLNVRSQVELSLMTPVRVTISILVDITYISGDVLNRLIRNHELFMDFLKSLLEFMRNYPERIQKYNNVISTIIETLIKYIANQRDRDNLKKIGDCLGLIHKENKVIFSELGKAITEHHPFLDNYLNNKGFIFNRLPDGNEYDMELEIKKEVEITSPEDEQIKLDLRGGYVNPDLVIIDIPRGLLRWQ